MNTKTTVISQAELDAQFACCDKIAAYWQTKGRTPTAYVETYGCQQNEADSEKLRGFLAQCGYAIVGSAEGADVVIMNTCAIREHAEQRVFGNLGALTHTKRRHPEQKIFLCGCMAGETKVSDRVKHSYPHVDGVFSTHHLWQFPQILWNVLSGKKRQFFIEDEPGSIAEGIPQVRDSKLKAWVSIMYGCNNFCTYCIVPYVRGRERSRQPEDILAECRALIEGGTKEITLLGQNVNSYGKDLSCGMDFADGDAVITMDGDLQHPPALIPTLIRKWQEGWDIVQAIRTATEDAGLVKRCTSAGYYAFINAISENHIRPGGSDFRLMDRRAILTFRRFREHSRFVRGIIGSMGYKQTTVEYVAPARHAGVSKYSMRKMLHLAMDGILTNSTVPLRMIFYVGLLSLVFGFLLILYVLGSWALGSTVPGWTTMTILLSLFGSLQLMGLGITGEYISRIFRETQNRPLYWLSGDTADDPESPYRRARDD